MNKVKIEKTNRGFSRIDFFDFYNHSCSLQKSSIAEVDCIWLGLDDVKPIIMARDVLGSSATGWLDYPLPENVHINSRMHLDREQVKALLPFLIAFVETGEIDGGPEPPQ